MTIRLSGHAKYPEIDATMADAGEYTVRTVYGQGIRLAYANTREEAEQAKRAFELVLAPRFTRDEAIAIVKANVKERTRSAGLTPPELRGIRLTLEALAAAGVFSDSRCAECRDDHRVMTCESCGKQTMSDKLDAAGIR